MSQPVEPGSQVSMPRTAAPSLFSPRVLVHADPADLSALARGPLATHPRAGLVLHRADVAAVRAARTLAVGPVLADAGAWGRAFATPADPFAGRVGAEAGLFSTTLDDYAEPFTGAGADVVLTPSGCVAEGDWTSLRAVLDAGGRTERADVLTLVAADAAMLDPAHAGRFSDELAGAGRPLAMLLAAKNQPFASRDRLAALRGLLDRLPGLVLLATEPLVALDAAARGGVGAVGHRGGLRRPGRPGDPGGPRAAGWLPGLLLARLWAVRSPSVYADWYAGTDSPSCDDCGRPLDVFATSDGDKDAILAHNVHELLRCADDLFRREGAARRQAHLAASIVDALAEHAALHPAAAGHEADPVLRRLAELDDPAGRRVLPSGAFRP